MAKILHLYAPNCILEMYEFTLIFIQKFMPFFLTLLNKSKRSEPRQDDLQANLEIPKPASTNW